MSPTSLLNENKHLRRKLLFDFENQKKIICKKRYKHENNNDIIDYPLEIQKDLRLLARVLLIENPTKEIELEIDSLRRVDKRELPGVQ